MASRIVGRTTWAGASVNDRPPVVAEVPRGSKADFTAALDRRPLCWLDVDLDGAERVRLDGANHAHWPPRVSPGSVVRPKAPSHGASHLSPACLRPAGPPVCGLCVGDVCREIFDGPSHAGDDRRWQSARGAWGAMTAKPGRSDGAMANAQQRGTGQRDEAPMSYVAPTAGRASPCSAACAYPLLRGTTSG